MEIIKTGGGVKRRGSLSGTDKDREKKANPTFWMATREKALVYVATLATAKLASLVRTRGSQTGDTLIEETRKYLQDAKIPDIHELAERLSPMYIEAALAIMQDLSMDERIPLVIASKGKREFENGIMVGILLMMKIVDATDPNDPSTEHDAFTIARGWLSGQRIPKSDFQNGIGEDDVVAAGKIYQRLKELGLL